MTVDKEAAPPSFFARDFALLRQRGLDSGAHFDYKPSEWPKGI